MGPGNFRANNLTICTVSAGFRLFSQPIKTDSPLINCKSLKIKQTQLETEWGQLLIEQSTFGVEGRIEQKEIEQLQMQLPELSKIVW
ncbi:MAG: hypothetical protein CM1200mP40_29150 [Gammaproteobacteria bacterium]|nr:MAG: hypothetical protein CM1200mP40_29150 [Gammaproteobacteria bacterium]